MTFTSHRRGVYSGYGRKRLKEGDRCKRGHLVIGDNAYEYSPGRYRCVRCHNEAAKKWQRDSRSVEYGGKLKQALQAIGMGLEWNEFQGDAERNGWNWWDALKSLLKMPLLLLGIDKDALKNYMDVVSQREA